jgi:hypothetical protein
VNSTRLGLAVLCAAAVLGVLGDGLLRSTPWGLNVTLLTLAIAIAIAVLDREYAGVSRPFVVRLAVPAVAFAACVAWRDSTTLKTLNVLGVVLILILMTLQYDWARMRAATLTHYVVGTAVASFNVALGLVLLVIGDVKWRDIKTDGWSSTTLAVIRGGIIAVPIVLVFGALLVSADVAFENLVSSVFAFDVENVFGHIVLATFLAWVACGFLRSIFFEPPADLSGVPRPSFIALGFVEVAVVLVALDLLFATFVAVQVPYLFGGETYARVTTGLTFAQYYRRGFFELVAVAALVLPLQLGLHWLLRKDNPNSERWFRVLAGVQIALVAIIMLSAVQRLRVYIAGYGLTELRLYTTAFLVWVGIVFVWFALSVLRGRRELFATGAMISAFAVAFALNALNPDALIVRSNLARSTGDGTFDAYYATSLSADAIPTLVEALPSLGYHDRCNVARDLKQKWDGTQQTDIRTWSMSRWLALRSLAAHREALQAADCGSMPATSPSISSAPR